MATANFQFERIQALKLNKKEVSDTYTVKTGRSVDGFIVDNPIDIVSPTDDFTLTVPDGEVMGQRLVISMTANADAKECTVAIAKHLDGTPEALYFDGVNEHVDMLWTGNEWVNTTRSAAQSTSG